MTLKTVLTPFLLAGAMLTVSACGSDSKEESEEKTSPAVALTELGKTRAGLEQALETYKTGDKAGADSQVSEAYLEHFEHVEGPLEAKDAELNEKLEHGIREGLREDVKSDKPAVEVVQAFEAVYVDLAKAEALLK